MVRLIELQQAVATAALGGDWQPAAALLHPRIPADRLAVYRNNVLGGLAEVLAAAYPSVAAVLGCEVFPRAGRGFAALQPPQVPQLWGYGAGFAAFLEAQPAGRVPPWLPDLARLDRAIHEAYFAADADPLSPAELAKIAATADPAALRFTLHPSLRLVSSEWPVYRLWQAVRDGCAIPAPLEMNAAPQAVLVARPELEVWCRPLDPWLAGFLVALLDDRTFGEAAAHATAAVPGVPVPSSPEPNSPGPSAAVQAALTFLLQAGLIINATASPCPLQPIPFERP